MEPSQEFKRILPIITKSREMFGLNLYKNEKLLHFIISLDSLVKGFFSHWQVRCKFKDIHTTPFISIVV